MSLFPEEMKEHIDFDFAPGASSGEKLASSPFDINHPWDIEFFYDGEIFAYVEVAERYSITFDKYPTQFIQDYKVEALPNASQPVFFVYVFSQSGEYYWTARALAKTYPTEITPAWVKELGRYRDQRNYEVAKEAWHSGVQSLVKEMLKGIVSEEPLNARNQRYRKVIARKTERCYSFSISLREHQINGLKNAGIKNVSELIQKLVGDWLASRDKEEAAKLRERADLLSYKWRVLIGEGQKEAKPGEALNAWEEMAELRSKAEQIERNIKRAEEERREVNKGKVKRSVVAT